MELRTLRYFLVIVQEGTFTKAAETAHVSQPALSRQIAELERELGVALFRREGRRLSLTEAGARLAQRAATIIDLADRAESEARQSEQELLGEIRVGGAECQAMSIAARAGAQLHRAHPGITFNVYGGNAFDVVDRLETGRLDFGLLTAPFDVEGYEHVELPSEEKWGLYLTTEHPFESRTTIRREDLPGISLIAPERPGVRKMLSGWLGHDFDRLDILAAYNLGNNALPWANELCCALVGTNVMESAHGAYGLMFKPFDPPLTGRAYLVWKREQAQTPAQRAFLSEVRAVIAP